MFMEETIKSIINLLVGAALFIIGMNMMSGGLKKVAGRSLKKFFNKIKNNRLVSLGIGAGVTAVIQSSGATAAMTVGFINTGVITVFQGICLILGAYIGTTVTGIIVSFASFDFAVYLLLAAFVGVVLMFFKNEKIKNIGEILAGFGVLFFGLDTMKAVFTAGSDITTFFQELFISIDFPLLLLLIGALFTCLTQSSSATSGIVIIMVGGGAIPLVSGFYLVLGATIGTVLTTIIAAIGGSINAKRTALVCLIVRILTALIATGIVWIVEFTADKAISNGLLNMFGNNYQFTVAMFLLFYNLIFIPILLPFVNQFVKLGELLLKDKDQINRKKALKFIDDQMLITPSIALGQAKNEVVNMLELAQANMDIAAEMIFTQNIDKKPELKEREEDIDCINSELTNFLIKLSNVVNLKEEAKIGSYFHSINDIERIGDHAINFLSTTESMIENDMHFSSAAIEELKYMYSIISKMFDVTKEVFTRKKADSLKQLDTLEAETDEAKRRLGFAHFERVTKNQCVADLGGYFTSLVGELERVGDHLVNVGYSITNPIGNVIAVGNSSDKVKSK